MIDGLAVNAYAEPVVSLDLDIVIAAGSIEGFIKALQPGFSAARHAHSVNLSRKGSDLRIQVQTDGRYQAFIPRSGTRKVLGIDMQVASAEDVLQGKIWAWSDETRRKSKRQKDLADIMRLVEAMPELESKLPEEVRRVV